MRLILLRNRDASAEWRLPLPAQLSTLAWVVVVIDLVRHLLPGHTHDHGVFAVIVLVLSLRARPYKLHGEAEHAFALRAASRRAPA